METMNISTTFGLYRFTYVDEKHQELFSCLDQTMLEADERYKAVYGIKPEFVKNLRVIKEEV